MRRTTLIERAIGREPIKVKHKFVGIVGWAVDFDPGGGIDLAVFESKAAALAADGGLSPGVIESTANGNNAWIFWEFEDGPTEPRFGSGATARQHDAGNPEASGAGAAAPAAAGGSLGQGQEDQTVSSGVKQAILAVAGAADSNAERIRVLEEAIKALAMEATKDAP